VFDFEWAHDFYVPPPVANGCQIYNCSGSPIVVPFEKSPEVKFSEPRIVFDLDADGSPEVISWPINGGFLVLDRDGDGQITSGKELFGDNTFPEWKNGFDALAFEGTTLQKERQTSTATQVPHNRVDQHRGCHGSEPSGFWEIGLSTGPTQSAV
jgi:hypothetical protein